MPVVHVDRKTRLSVLGNGFHGECQPCCEVKMLLAPADERFDVAAGQPVFISVQDQPVFRKFVQGVIRVVDRVP